MRKVVIVEDDTLLAQHFERILTRGGFEVSTISHALGALDLIDEFTPDVLVVDMLLSGSTAMPLLHEIKSHDDLAELPVVMVTSLGDGVSQKELAPYGVQMVLDKATLHPDDLVVAVKKVLAP